MEKPEGRRLAFAVSHPSSKKRSMDGAPGLVKRCFWAVLFSTALFVSSIGAQSSPGGQSPPQETQVRGYWIDPSTGLMWAGKDNDKDVNWKNAVNYCRDLRLAGYSDWRLASLGELEGIYDKNVSAPGRAGPPGKDRPFTWHVKGNLFLTGNQWSSIRFGGWAPRFDFNEGRVFNGDEVTFYTNKRALCVRTPDKRSVQSP